MFSCLPRFRTMCLKPSQWLRVGAVGNWGVGKGIWLLYSGFMLSGLDKMFTADSFFHRALPCFFENLPTRHIWVKLLTMPSPAYILSVASCSPSGHCLLLAGSLPWLAGSLNYQQTASSLAVPSCPWYKFLPCRQRKHSLFLLHAALSQLCHKTSCLAHNHLLLDFWDLGQTPASLLPQTSQQISVSPADHLKAPLMDPLGSSWLQPPSFLI